MSCLTTFPTIDPAAEETLTFAFANGLAPGVTLLAPSVVVTTSGTDPLPASRFSSPQVVGSSVLIVASTCQDGNVYHVRVIAPTSDPDTILVLAGDLACVLS